MSKLTFTLRGEGRWVRIINKDKVSGKFQLGLVVDAEDAEEVIQAINDTAQESHPKEFKAKKVSLNYETLEDGRILFKLRSAWKPTLTDAKGRVIKGDPKIGDGSVLKVRFGVQAAGFGDATKKRSVLLSPKAVMLVTLLAYTGAGWGDDDLEDGYESDGSEEAPETEDNDAEGDDAPPDSDGDEEPRKPGRKVDF
jgi:hypothetical protein